MPNVYQFKDFEGSSHRILLDLIPRFTTTGGAFLDLGAAGGELAQSLKARFRKSIGIDYDADQIPMLKANFDQGMIADLETLSELPRNMDAIVLADVLEHLRDPRHALSMVRKALSPSGVMFISVPNIANITIRIGLLFGVFRYRERGILDSTHLRFYTLRTIREDLEAAGFEILATRGSSVPVRLIVGKTVPAGMIEFGEKILTGVTSLWKALFAYQIILVARRAEVNRAS